MNQFPWVLTRRLGIPHMVAKDDIFEQCLIPKGGCYFYLLSCSANQQFQGAIIIANVWYVVSHRH